MQPQLFRFVSIVRPRIDALSLWMTSQIEHFHHSIPYPLTAKRSFTGTLWTCGEMKVFVSLRLSLTV